MSRPITHSLVQALRGVQAFAALDDDTLLEIVGASANLFWRAGSVVYEQGDAPEALYVVLSGAVALRQGQDADPVMRIEAGDCLGARSLLRGLPHSTQALAVEDAELMVIPEAALSAMRTAHPDLEAHLRAHVADYEARLEQRGRSEPRA